MVSLDENRRPMAVPKIAPQTYDEKRRFKEGMARAKRRNELRQKRKNPNGHV